LKLESLNQLIENLEKLPTIGRKSATRMAMFLIKNRYEAIKIANSIENAVVSINECENCGNLTEYELCEICMTEREKKICIVESSKDIFILEENKIFNGYYFVIPILENEKIEKLEDFIQKKGIKEILFAYPHSIENDAKIIYLEDRLKEYNLIFSKIAQGIPTGVKFENVDITSLTKAFQDRVKL